MIAKTALERADISSDDVASFLGIYAAKGIVAVDPFVSIDYDGVGELVRIATERGRKVRPNLKLGICGEHGGDPASVAFCHEIGLSPFGARLRSHCIASGRETIRATPERRRSADSYWRRRGCHIRGFAHCR
jgi:hypothetical protein